jgi:outer membrane cobalamin receptor
MGKKLHTFLLVLLLFPIALYSQDTTTSIYNYSLKDLANAEISTGSIRHESEKYAPSNIWVINSDIIEERGYQTLVDVCQDIPGFDFLTFNDGGGEYSTFNLNRGLGHVGNSEILIMIDGIIQNQISYNWSPLWTYDGMFIDIDRIEIIQGPGSMMYGAQAFSGVINLISKKGNHELTAKTFLGSGNTMGIDVYYNNTLSKNLDFNIAVHKYQSDGDQGIDRYDPASYFSGNVYPEAILYDYDQDGNYVTNSSNPKSGEQIPEGFNTMNNCYSIRSAISYKNTSLHVFISDSKKAYASALTPFEYQATDPNYYSHDRLWHIGLSNNHRIGNKIHLKSQIVYRGTDILPDGGLKYYYQFPEYLKSYSSYSQQFYIDEKLILQLSQKDELAIGMKGVLSNKMERMISLDSISTSHNYAVSSWDIASDGEGLYKSKEYPGTTVNEISSTVLWDRLWSKLISSSAGLRFDLSSEFGNIISPMVAVDYNPTQVIGLKVMFGSAFRQPSIFELTSEFRGNPNLNPQQIKTHELEIYNFFESLNIQTKTNIFYSKITNQIGKVNDPTMPAGERYENLDDMSITGVSFHSQTKILQKHKLYFNYNLLLGIEHDSNKFYDIDHTAKHKINAGVNLHLLKGKATTDLRMNYVGKRKAPESNIWMQEYQSGYAPSYLKFNLNLTLKINEIIYAQIKIDNLFDEKYYGVGRESGSSFIDRYDYQTNINPEGIIPAYHPQPGRNYLISLIIKPFNHEK